MKLDAQKKHGVMKIGLYPQDDEETGELTEEVERAAGSFDPFSQSEIDDPDYRSQLDAGD